MAVMSGASAGKTLLQIKEAKLKANGINVSEEEKIKILKDIETQYNEQLSPYYAAARLWVDGVIDPIETRKIISMGIEAANHNPNIPRYNVGVIQT
jgi:acetyl-CoA carboxylase carboxyltransferase component